MIARKVEALTRPLPRGSSSASSSSGSTEYLKGPNSADWVPARNTASISAATLPNAKPATATPTVPISASLIQRTARARSGQRSAKAPALAANRKYGSMKKPTVSWMYSARLSSAPSAPKVIIATRALRRTLSLRAPPSWTTNSGAKRRWRRRAKVLKASAGGGWSRGGSNP